MSVPYTRLGQVRGCRSHGIAQLFPSEGDAGTGRVWITPVARADHSGCVNRQFGPQSD